MFCLQLLGCFLALNIWTAEVNERAGSGKHLALSTFALTAFSVSGVSGSLLMSHNPPVQFCVSSILILCCNLFILSGWFGPKVSVTPRIFILSFRLWVKRKPAEGKRLTIERCPQFRSHQQMLHIWQYRCCVLDSCLFSMAMSKCYPTGGHDRLKGSQLLGRRQMQTPLFSWLLLHHTWTMMTDLCLLADCVCVLERRRRPAAGVRAAGWCCTGRWRSAEQVESAAQEWKCTGEALHLPLWTVSCSERIEAQHRRNSFITDACFSFLQIKFDVVWRFGELFLHFHLDP